MSQDLSRQVFFPFAAQMLVTEKTFVTSLTPCSAGLWSLNLALRGRSPVVSGVMVSCWCVSNRKKKPAVFASGFMCLKKETQMS